MSTSNSIELPFFRKLWKKNDNYSFGPHTGPYSNLFDSVSNEILRKQ